MNYVTERSHITRTMRMYERPKNFYERPRWLVALMIMSMIAMMLVTIMQ